MPSRQDYASDEVVIFLSAVGSDAVSARRAQIYVMQLDMTPCAP